MTGTGALAVRPFPFLLLPFEAALFVGYSSSSEAEELFDGYRASWIMGGAGVIVSIGVREKIFRECEEDCTYSRGY